MATISSTLQLQNRMTPVLNSIVRALETTIIAMQHAGHAGGAAFSEAEQAILDARRALNDLNGGLVDIPGNVQGATNGFTIMRGVIANIVADMARMAFRGLTDSIKAGITMASDLQEIQNVLDKTFEGSSGVISDWSKTALEAYGLNELSAKRYVSTMGAMLKASGASSESVAVMSTSLTGLAGDIASFHNLKPDEAFYKLQAAMSGEIEPLRRLGYNMTVANLEAYALSQGIKTSYEHMNEASRATLRYNFIMDKTKDLQGDFVDTAGNFANQQRLMSENWNELSAQVMQNILPALTAILVSLNSLVNALKPFAPIIFGVIAGLTVAIGVILAVTAAQWLWNAAMAANPITWVIMAIVALAAIIGGLIAWIVMLWKTNIDFRVGVIGAWNAVLNFFDGVPLFFQKVGNGILDIFSWIRTGVADELQRMINGAIDNLNGFVKLLNQIPGVSLEMIGSVTFATQDKLAEAAKKQARDANVQTGQNALNAKVEGRAKELEQYKTEQVRIQKQQQADEARKKSELAAFQSLQQDGVAVNGGTIDKIKGDVSITEEDIKLLKDVAATEFVNKYTSLRPEMKVTFGDIRETADVGQIMTVIETMVERAYGSALGEVG